MNGQIYIQVRFLFLHELYKLMLVLLCILFFQAGSLVFRLRDNLGNLLFVHWAVFGKYLIKYTRLFESVKAESKSKKCQSEIRRKGRIIAGILSKDDIYPQDENSNISCIETYRNDKQPAEGDFSGSIADKVLYIPLVVIDKYEGNYAVGCDGYKKGQAIDQAERKKGICIQEIIQPHDRPATENNCHDESGLPHY